MIYHQFFAECGTNVIPYIDSQKRIDAHSYPQCTYPYCAQYNSTMWRLFSKDRKDAFQSNLKNSLFDPLNLIHPKSHSPRFLCLSCSAPTKCYLLQSRSRHRGGFRDPSSLSDPSAVYATHLSLDIGVDFEIETLGGTATWTLSILDESVTYVDLDARGLIVRKVVDADTDATLPFEYEPNVNAIGDRLRITLSRGAGERGSARVTIYYASRGSGSPAGGACDWTDARDGRKPFLFTQAQAIHARSFLPCQDTPSVKFTYQAVVKVMTPHEDLQVLMAAVSLGRDDDGSYTFVQNVPIPSYLVAMAVGDLKGEKVSDRCTVWAEPDVVEKAKWEFEEVEQFLRTAEKLAGKYVWGVYDLLVLPASFPYGGMENPCLTFLTPSLLSVRIPCSQRGEYFVGVITDSGRLMHISSADDRETAPSFPWWHMRSRIHGAGTW